MALSQKQVGRLWEAVRQKSRELIWELGPDGTLVYLSDAAAEVLGAPAEELTGQNGFGLIYQEDVDRALGLFFACLENKTGWDKIRVRVVRPDGATPWVETSGVAHVDRSGGLLGFTATTRRLDAEEVHQVELELVRERIEAVIAGRALRTVWQPIYSLSDGHVVGAEALSRFTHRVSQTPDRWFADAADVGLGTELELLALETALAAAGPIPERVYLSVNASPAVVASGQVATALERAAVEPGRIVLELTEHVSIEDYDGLEGPLRDLRDLGVRIAVDDAGAGFASFRHILRLGPDIIKLDQSIVQGVTTNPAQRALATAVALFALEVGEMRVVAEGVESACDLSTVTSLGIDAAQGYHLCRPTAASQVDWAGTVGDPPARRNGHVAIEL